MDGTSKSLTSPTERATALLAEHEQMPKPSWAKLGKYYGGIPGGTLSRIAQSGGEFFPAKWADLLGVKVVAMIPAPACPKCGEVHVTKRCNKTAKVQKSEKAPEMAWWRGLNKARQRRLIASWYRRSPLQACARNGRKVAK
jgi:hypothetical protein